MRGGSWNNHHDNARVKSRLFVNDFHWFVQRELGCGAYLRYVDDFVLFSDDKHKLWSCKQSIIACLAQERLTIHEAGY